MPTNSRVRLRDSNVLDGIHRSADGYLAAYARVARVGTQQYMGSEVGRPDLGKVTLYRPEAEVFHKDALRSMAHRPVTLTHPPEMVDSNNWGKYAVGHSDAEVARDGDCIRVPMVLMDQVAIDAVEKEGVRQLSVGYLTDIDWTPGKTPQGEAYDGVQTNIRGNHHALVPLARGGPRLRFGDAMKCADCGKPWVKDAKVCDCGGSTPTTDRDWTEEERRDAERKGHAMEGGKFPIEDPADVRAAVKLYGRSSDPAATKAFIIKRAKAIGATSELPDDWKKSTNDAARGANKGRNGMPITMMLDGQPVEVVDAISEGAIKKIFDTFTKRLADAEKKAKDDEEEMEKDKKKATDAIEGLRKEVATKDGQIAALTQQVKDAQITPEKLDILAADRAAVVDAAKPFLPKDFVFAKKAIVDIQRAAVAAKLTDSDVKDWSAEKVEGAFQFISKAPVNDGASRLAKALGDSARARGTAVNMNDAEAAAAAAHAEWVASLNGSARKTA